MLSFVRALLCTHSSIPDDLVIVIERGWSAKMTSVKHHGYLGRRRIAARAKVTATSMSYANVTAKNIPPYEQQVCSSLLVARPHISPRRRIRPILILRCLLRLRY
jgi:hypothetical protein